MSNELNSLNSNRPGNDWNDSDVALVPRSSANVASYADKIET